MPVKRRVPWIEMITHHAIQLLPVVDFEIVFAGWIVVDVGSQGIRFVVEAKDGLDSLNERLQGVSPLKAAVVVQVVGQQSRSRCAERS